MVKDNLIRNLVIVLAGLLVIVFAMLVSLAFSLTTVQTLVVNWVLTTLYAAGVIMAIDPRTIINPVRFVEKQVPVERQVFVDRPVFVEKEVVKEVPVQIPVENRTIQIVEKKVEVPVYREVRVPVYKTKYIERKRKKLEIPKFDFVGSTETRTYHKRNCRFSKLIKKKFKVSANTKVVFKKKHFKVCKMCLGKK